MNSNSQHFAHIWPSCPNCKKENSATMSYSEWGHSHACCSDKCGRELKEKLDKFESSPQYDILRLELDDAHLILQDAYLAAVGVSCRYIKYL